MCTERELRRVLLDTKSGLDDIFGARLQNVILYGSYARGEQDAESDIDVMALVDLPKEELVRYRRRVSDFSSRIDLEYDVLLSIKLQDVETFRRYSDSLPFFQNVIREGIRIVQ